MMKEGSSAKEHSDGTEEVKLTIIKCRDWEYDMYPSELVAGGAKDTGITFKLRLSRSLAGAIAKHQNCDRWISCIDMRTFFSCSAKGWCVERNHLCHTPAMSPCGQRPEEVTGADREEVLRGLRVTIAVLSEGGAP